MPIPVEKVAAGLCFRANDNVLRKVLLIQDQRVTYILHEKLAWTVLRYYANIDRFAQECDAQVDCASFEAV
jgi:hypothetical protein